MNTFFNAVDANKLKSGLLLITIVLLIVHLTSADFSCSSWEDDKVSYLQTAALVFLPFAAGWELFRASSK